MGRCDTLRSHQEIIKRTTLRRRRQAPGPQSALKNHGQATLAQTRVFEQGSCTVSIIM